MCVCIHVCICVCACVGDRVKGAKTERERERERERRKETESVHHTCTYPSACAARVPTYLPLFTTHWNGSKHVMVHVHMITADIRQLT